MGCLEFIIAFLDVLPSVALTAFILYLFIFQKKSLRTLGDWFQATIQTLRIPGVELKMHPPRQPREAPKAPIDKETSTEKKVEEPGDKQLLALVAAWQELWKFEWIWGLIYKSQIEILEISSSRKSEGLYWSEAAAHYCTTSIAFPALKDYGFNNYIQFLIDNKLITEHKTKAYTIKYQITEYGERFLIYLEKMQYKKEMRIY